MLDLICQRTDDIFGSQIDSEKVLFDAKTGDSFGLSVTGTAIWDHLAKPITMETLCQKLVSEFEVDLDQCYREVSAYIALLEEKDLVIIRPQD